MAAAAAAAQVGVCGCSGCCSSSSNRADSRAISHARVSLRIFESQSHDIAPLISRLPSSLENMYERERERSTLEKREGEKRENMSKSHESHEERKVDAQTDRRAAQHHIPLHHLPCLLACMQSHIMIVVVACCIIITDGDAASRDDGMRARRLVRLTP